jgi:hypothetical protein
MDACMHAAAWTSGHNKWMHQKPFSPGLTHARWGSTVLTGHVTARDAPMLRPPHVRHHVRVLRTRGTFQKPTC